MKKVDFSRKILCIPHHLSLEEIADTLSYCDRDWLVEFVKLLDKNTKDYTFTLKLRDYFVEEICTELAEEKQSCRFSK